MVLKMRIVTFTYNILPRVFTVLLSFEIYSINTLCKVSLFSPELPENVPLDWIISTNPFLAHLHWKRKYKKSFSIGVKMDITTAPSPDHDVLVFVVFSRDSFYSESLLYSVFTFR